jgi:hypothetical protein
MTKALALRIDTVPYAVTDAVNAYCINNGAVWYPSGGNMTFYWQFADEAVITAVLLKFPDVPLRVVDL